MSGTGLARYGVRPATIVREPARDSDGVPICAECGHPVPKTKGPQRIHNPDVIDRTLRQLLDDRKLITFGFRCESHNYEVVMPDRCSGPDASSFIDGWTGVRIAFSDGHARYVPVPEREVEGGETA